VRLPGLNRNQGNPSTGSRFSPDVAAAQPP
jgi:hypothetical protein